MSVYIATYFDDVNPASGDFASPIIVNLLTDERGNTIYTDSYDKMLEEVKKDIEVFQKSVQNKTHVKINAGGIYVLDEDDYQICTYTIHELENLKRI